MAVTAAGSSTQSPAFVVNDPIERSKLEQAVNENNKKLEIDGRKIKQQLDKDDFMMLMIAQLKNQDPTNPVDDKQSIAQMAQFSSLEQMSNMSRDFKLMATMIGNNNAASVLGKSVDVDAGNREISGVVQSVEMGETPQILVDGYYYDYSKILRVKQN